MYFIEYYSLLQISTSTKLIVKKVKKRNLSKMALNRHEDLKSKFKLTCGFPNMFKKVTKSTPGISEILQRKLTLRRYQSKERKTSNVSNDSEEDDKFEQDRNIDVDSKKKKTVLEKMKMPRNKKIPKKMKMKLPKDKEVDDQFKYSDLPISIFKDVLELELNFIHFYQGRNQK